MAKDPRATNDHLSIDEWFARFLDACEHPPMTRDAFFEGAIAAARLFGEAIALPTRPQSIKAIELLIEELYQYERGLALRNSILKADLLDADRFVAIGHAIRDREQAPPSKPINNGHHRLAIHKTGAK